jgi:alpha-D-xyloside xylohydrolase
MGRLTAAAALLALLTACGSAAPAQGGLALRIDRDPFRLTLVRDGKVVVAEDTDARLRYQLRSTGDQYKLTYVRSSHGNVYEVATSEPGRTATVTVARTGEGARLSVRLHPATNVQFVYDAFGASPRDHFLGGGERGNTVDLRGQIVPVQVGYTCASAPVPFFGGSAGWGLWLDTHDAVAMAFPGSPGGGGCRFGTRPQCLFPPLQDRVEVCQPGARLDEELYVGTISETLAAYEADAGRPRVPPPSELELIKWRDVATGPRDLLEDVDRLRAAQIPIGWELLDNPWESCVGTLTFDRRRFPDPAGLIRRIHTRGVRFMLWVSPKLQCDAGYPPSARLGTVDQLVLDLTQPSVAREFEARLRKLVALGVDGVKADRGDEVDLAGKGAALQNEYPLVYARAVMGVLPSHAAAIFRAATTGSQTIVPGLWAGDQSGDFAGLQSAVRAGATAGTSGFPVWGSDVGGYHSQALTGDVFARWAQLGAVSPVMEVGGQGLNATPWKLGPAAMTALRDAAVLHYELAPLFLSLLRRGEPVLRPLGYGYPDDPGAWRADLELLVGPDLLAAPVTGGGTTPSVYLPPGSWIDLATGAVVSGGRTFTRATPLTELPLYLRAGAVVPFNLRTHDSFWGVNELEHHGRAGFLAADGAKLDLRGQPHDVQVFVPASQRPGAVTLAGSPVAWSWNAGSMPGVVIRLHGPAIGGEIRLSRA